MPLGGAKGIAEGWRYRQSVSKLWISASRSPLHDKVFVVPTYARSNIVYFIPLPVQLREDHSFSIHFEA